jgi:hypothetical protein
MARKNTEETVESNEVSEAAAATRAEIGNRPRQSVVRFIQHYLTIKETSPDLVDELFGNQAEAIEAWLEANPDKVVSPIQAAIEKATANQQEISEKALRNEDALNGYAGYVFDSDVADEKTREKKERVVKSKVEKVADLLSGDISDEDAAALKELLAARGL